MRKNIKLFKYIILFSIILLTNSKAELTNKVIISVGHEIITNYDMDKEYKYLNVITLGQFKNYEKKKAKEIATDSLIKDKIKLNAISSFTNLNISEAMINNQIAFTAQTLGFGNEKDFKIFLELEDYKFEEFKEKVLLELKWNQLVYQYYKNQIIVDKEKIDEQLKEIISNQKKEAEYLIYEIFIENSSIKKLGEIDEKKIDEKKIDEKIVEKKNTIQTKEGINIETENISYDNKKKIIEVKKPIKKEIVKEKKNKIDIDELIKNIKEKGFKNSAIQFSSSPTSQEGGRLGWIHEKELSDMLLKHIKEGDVGEITEPIVVPGGIIILKLEDKKVIENKIDLDTEMKKLVEKEKNVQLLQFSSNLFNQFKSSVRIKYFNE